jgi:hypothetical protein
MQVKDEGGAFRAVECPHSIERITAYEERTGLRRV